MPCGYIVNDICGRDSRPPTFSVQAKVESIVTAIAIDDTNSRSLMLDQLVSSSVLTISRSTDIDHFKSIEDLADARSIPLAWKDFRACFATVTLRSCTIFLQRTFSRILEAISRHGRHRRLRDG